jgi:hypothetical protein
MSINREELLGEFQNRLEKLNDSVNGRPNEIDGGYHDSARRKRSQQTEEDNATTSIHSLIQQVSGESMGESDRLLGELTKVRDMLQIERDRIMGEIAEYTTLNQSAMTAMKVLAENLTQYQRTGKLEARRG